MQAVGRRLVRNKLDQAAIMAGVKRLVESRGISDEQTVEWVSHVLSKIDGGLREKVRLVKTLDAGGAISGAKLAAQKPGVPFKLTDLLKTKKMGGAVHKMLSEWRPGVKGGVSVGAHEIYLTLCVKGATLTDKGDLHVPGLGNVEVKSVADKSSHVCFGDDVLETEARLRARRLLERDFTEVKSMSRKTLTKMRDSHAEGRFVSDLKRLFEILTLGQHSLPDSVAREAWNQLDDSFYGLLAATSFDRCKKRRGFDTCLLINRETERAVFLPNGATLLACSYAGFVKLVPSALSFTSERGSSVGVTLE